MKSRLEYVLLKNKNQNQAVFSPKSLQYVWQSLGDALGILRPRRTVREGVERTQIQRVWNMEDIFEGKNTSPIKGKQTWPCLCDYVYIW